MHVDSLTETIYIDRDNIFKITVKFDNVLVDFTDTNRYLLTLTDDDAQFTIDTDVDGSVITGDDQGVLTFDISQLVTETGFYSAKLVIFDPTNTDGLVIISPCGGNYPKLSVNVCGN